MDHIAVAVDGPAGAGKSTVSKAVAAASGYEYIDTGAMYRAVAYYTISHGFNCKKAEEVLPLLNDINITMKYDSDAGIRRIYLNGEDVTDAVRQEAVSVGASDVGVIPEVRRKLVQLQRRMAESADVIMDGRDICSYVLPQAQVKIFLTASLDARVKRRCLDLEKKGADCDYETVKRDMAYRDKNDSTRKTAPLAQAPDAVLLDTSELTFEETVAAVRRIIADKLKIIAGS